MERQEISAVAMAMVPVSVEPTLVMAIFYSSEMVAVENKNSNAWLSDPETRISFIFARCRPTQSRCGVAPAGSVVWLAAAATGDTAVGNMLINN